MLKRAITCSILAVGLFLIRGSEAEAQLSSFLGFPGSYAAHWPVLAQPPMYYLTPSQGPRYPLGGWMGYSGGVSSSPVVGPTGYGVLPSSPKDGWSGYNAGFYSSPRAGSMGYNVLPRW
jgi:hypothetical protein